MVNVLAIKYRIFSNVAFLTVLGTLINQREYM